MPVARQQGGETHGDAAVLGEHLGGNAAQGAEHGPPGVDDLDLPVAGEGLGVCGQSSCVPACRQIIISLQCLLPSCLQIQVCRPAAYKYLLASTNCYLAALGPQPAALATCMSMCQAACTPQMHAGALTGSFSK